MPGALATGAPSIFQPASLMSPARSRGPARPRARFPPALPASRPASYPSPSPARLARLGGNISQVISVTAAALRAGTGHYIGVPW